LERLFAQLVRNLAAISPARLRTPMTLAELRESIIPYRANRRALQLESVEDYELVVLRLCAGEGGLVRTEPEEVRARYLGSADVTTPDGSRDVREIADLRIARGIPAVEVASRS
jgi:hypothetical protein